MGLPFDDETRRALRPIHWAAISLMLVSMILAIAVLSLGGELSTLVKEAKVEWANVQGIYCQLTNVYDSVNPVAQGVGFFVLAVNLLGLIGYGYRNVVIVAVQIGFSGLAVPIIPIVSILLALGAMGCGDAPEIPSSDSGWDSELSSKWGSILALEIVLAGFLLVISILGCIGVSWLNKKNNDFAPLPTHQPHYVPVPPQPQPQNLYYPGPQHMPPGPPQNQYYPVSFQNQ